MKKLLFILLILISTTGYSQLKRMLLMSQDIAHGTDTYTSSGTWVCPYGITSITAHCVGGGGTGAPAYQNPDVGGGGGGGAYSNKVITVSYGNSYTVTVGAGGIGSVNSSITGSDSEIKLGVTTLINASGGIGGTLTSNAGGSGGIAALGVGDVRYNGGDGGDGVNDNYSGGGGGAGGTGGDGGDGSGQTAGTGTSNYGGDGATGRTTQGIGASATDIYGGGGAGGWTTNDDNYAGGSGADGVVIIIY